MKQRALLFFVLLASAISVMAAEQDKGNIKADGFGTVRSTLVSALAGGVAGMEFYITFPPRYKPANGSPTYKIYVSSPVQTKVRLEVEGKGVLTEKMTVANDVVDFSLSSATAEVWSRKPSDAIPIEQVYSQAAVHITAEAPVVVVAVSLYEDGGGDSFLALPVNALGKEYIVSSMPDAGWKYGNLSFPSEVCVVAPYNNTQITVTIGGNAAIQTEGGLTLGKSKSFTLNRGDVFVVTNAKNNQGGDLSGSKIISTKPISVISGQQCANVPSDKGRCGYLAEMELPTSMWGKNFQLPRYVQRNRSAMVKIVAKEANTKVFKNGTYWRTIKASGGVEGNGYLYERIDSTGNNLAFLSSDKPISLTLFNPSSEDDNYATMPFQMMIMPMEQYHTQFSFHTPGVNGNKGMAQNYCTIVYPLATNYTIPDSLEFGVLQNGAVQWRKLSAVFGSTVGTIYPVQVNGISYAAKVCVLPGDKAYSLRAPSNQPFMCYCYGSSDSLAYGHPAGAALTSLLEDNMPPDPHWILACDGSTQGALVIDLPNNPDVRTNLARIALDSTLSKNYRLEYDAFTPGEAAVVKWVLKVINPNQDAVAVLTFTDGAGNDTTIRISHIAANITLDRDIDFGVSKLGDKKTQTIRIYNEGASATVVTRLEWQGSKGQGSFEMLNVTLPFVLQPGEKKDIEIQFTAKAEGGFQDSLGVGDSCTFRYSRMISAHVGAPVITVSDINFGQVLAGNAVTKTFTIANKGTDRLVITGATSPAPDEGIFYPEQKIHNISPSTPLILEPMGYEGDNAILNVTFFPVAPQRYTATITFSANAIGWDNVLVLNGEGTRTVDVAESATISAPRIESIIPSPIENDGSDIHVSLANVAAVRLDIVNINGEVVATLLNTTMSEGKHSVHFAPTAGIANGVYLLRMQAGTEFITKPFILSRR